MGTQFGAAVGTGVGAAVGTQFGAAVGAGVGAAVGTESFFFFSLFFSLFFSSYSWAPPKPLGIANLNEHVCVLSYEDPLDPRATLTLLHRRFLPARLIEAIQRVVDIPSNFSLCR